LGRDRGKDKLVVKKDTRKSKFEVYCTGCNGKKGGGNGGRGRCHKGVMRGGINS